MNDQTRREIMEAAWDKAENEDEKTGTIAEEKDDSGVIEAESDLGEAPDKEITEEKDSQTIEKKAADRQQVQKDPKKEKVAEKDTKKGPVRAPASWSAAERPLWDKVPREVQSVISRRERETAMALQESAGARQFTQQFLDVVNPFAALIRSQNSTPLDAVRNLMTTAAGLSTGSADQKAMIIAEICSNYGVDIQKLDTALVAMQQPGANPSAGRGAVDPNVLQLIQPMQAFMSEIQTSRQQRNQELKLDAEEQVEDFGKDKEFFEELREEMADYVDWNSARNKKVTLDQAYDFVLQQHPDYYKVVQKKRRETNGDAARQNQTLSNARRAASSISGSPSLSEAKPKVVTRKDALNAAWDELAGQ